MATEMIKIGDYTVNYVSAGRVAVLFDGGLVCKYNRTKDGLAELLADLIDFLVEDKIIKRKDEKATRTRVLTAITTFAI